MGIFNFFKRNKKSGTEAAAAPVPEAESKIEEEVVSRPAEPVREAEKPVGVRTEAAPEAMPAVRENSGRVLVKLRYNRSYTAKLIQSDDRLKAYYGEIRNELMRYNVKARASWRYETFKTGRKLLARLAIRGKTLGLYLALDPAAYDGTKYKTEDVSAVAKNADVPVLYRIKNDRRCKYSKELIAAVMSANGLEAGDAPTEDYAAIYPYEELEPLIVRGLVKILKQKERSEGSEEGLIEISEERYEQLTAEADYSEVAVSAEDEPHYPEVVESISVAEAEEKIADEEVKTFIRESERFSDKTKKDIVNIDALSRYFKAGETVTVEEIRKRVPSVNSKATYIKVLARGILDKPLNVEADDFSPAAIKMIVLTGGTVSRTKTRN